MTKGGMLIVIIDYLMQIINPLGKITMLWAKTFSTNTYNNQTGVFWGPQGPIFLPFCDLSLLCALQIDVFVPSLCEFIKYF